MAFEWLQSLPNYFGEAGAGVLGLVAGNMKMRHGRLAKLEREVEECRHRDARMKVVEAGFRLVVGEMVRENPNSPALRMCGDLLNRKLGPVPHDMAGFQDLLNDLDRLDEAKREDDDGVRS